MVTAPERVGVWQAAPWLPAGVDAVVAGGPSRQVSVAAGVRYLAAVDPEGDDRPVLVHDGARPLVAATLVTAVVEAVLRPRCRDPGAPRGRDAQAGRGRAGARDRRPIGPRGGADAPGRTPRPAARGLGSIPTGRPARSSPTRPRCSRPVPSLFMRLPGEPANLKVTLPDDLRRVEAALAPDAARIGFGHDSHPFGPGAPLRLGGIEIVGAPRARRSLRWRRRAPRRGRRAARCGRPGRPRTAVSCGRANPARDRQRRAPARGRRASWSRRPPPRHGGPRDHRGPPEARGPARRDACGDRGAARHRARGRQRQGIQRQPRRGRGRRPRDVGAGRRHGPDGA